MADSTLEIRADEWIEQNPDVWARFVTRCLWDAAHDRRISVQYLIEDVRKHDYVNRIGDPCKINNSYSPIFARKLIEQYPELRPFIEIRRSVYDKGADDAES